MKIPTNRTLILSGEDMQQIMLHFGLHPIMDALIARMKKTIQNYNPEEIKIPVRSGFNYEQPFQGLIEWMPLYKKGEQVMIKVVGYHPSNPGLNGLPTIVSTFSSYDTTSGHLLGIMDGVFITALRTGAASAIASAQMAHPESEILGIIGCGTQAVTQVHALSRIFHFKKILIYDSDPGTCASFKDRTSILDIDAEIIISDIEEIVMQSDILVTATSIDVGAGPLFKGIETKSHLHVNAVGSDFPGKLELPLDLLQKSFVCPDFAEQAIIEGECQQLEKDQIGPELEEIVKRPENYEHLKYKRSVFDSTGWTLEDNVVMELFLDYASELKLGKEIEIEFVPDDAKNPYEFLGTFASIPEKRL